MDLIFAVEKYILKEPVQTCYHLSVIETIFARSESLKVVHFIFVYAKVYEKINITLPFLLINLEIKSHWKYWNIIFSLLLNEFWITNVCFGSDFSVFKPKKEEQFKPE